MVKLEQSSDREREDVVARVLEREWDKTVCRYSVHEYSPVDFQVLDCRVPVALLELKCRDNADDAFPTLFVAQRKVDALVELSGEWGVPGLFVGAFSNGVIRAVSVRRILDVPIQQIVRTKPRASGHVGMHDSELARLVPIDRMKVVARMRKSELAIYNAVHQRV